MSKTDSSREPHDLSPDFGPAGIHADLYRHYREFLRDTPVFRSDDGTVYLTRHADVMQLFTDARLRRSPPGGGSNPFSAARRESTPLEAMISHWLVYMDPPRHDDIRAVLNRAFTIKYLDQQTGRIRAIAADLLAALPGQGPAELVGAFAFQLPVQVIAGLLGVPAGDREMFREWSADITRAVDTGGEAELAEGAAASLAFRDYIAGLIDAGRDTPWTGLLGDMITAHDAGLLTRDELIYSFAFLIWAGHETTRNLISNGAVLLADHPQAWATLQSSPAGLDAAVEEMLRYDSPVQKLSRWTHDNVDFGGYRVPKGTLVTGLVGAANRDPTVFSDPDRFIIDRAPNRHLAFGKGIHHCIGASLARLEGRIAFELLLQRYRGLEVTDYRWRPYSAFRSMEYLNVVLR